MTTTANVKAAHRASDMSEDNVKMPTKSNGSGSDQVGTSSDAGDGVSLASAKTTQIGNGVAANRSNQGGDNGSPANGKDERPNGAYLGHERLRKRTRSNSRELRDRCREGSGRPRSRSRSRSRSRDREEDRCGSPSWEERDRSSRRRSKRNRGNDAGT